MNESVLYECKENAPATDTYGTRIVLERADGVAGWLALEGPDIRAIERLGSKFEVGKKYRLTFSTESAP